MLHEKKCRFCQAKNDYYDHEIDPHEDIIKKAQEALKKFVMDVPQSMIMYYQEENSFKNTISSRQSLKSAKGPRK